MPTRSGPRRLAGVLLMLALAMSLVGCRDGSASPAPAPVRPTGAAAIATRAQLQGVLDRRARAIRDDDLAAFVATLDPARPAFVRREVRYFHNLTKLPLERFDYRVLTRQWPVSMGVGRGTVVPEVRFTLQLTPYDERPVSQVTGFSFARRSGHLVIVGDRPPGRAFYPGFEPSPWDLAPIEVDTRSGVLALYDQASSGNVALVAGVTSEAVRQVQDAVPFTWNEHVVLYDLADKAVLNSYRDVPGGNINHLGALTFPVHADGDEGRVVAMRFTVLPTSIRAGQPFLGRIIRHELTHVALGTRDDGIPTWLAEGLAEYVGARPIPTVQRRIARVAVSRAAGDVSSMPASSDFNGTDQGWNYALSWMACDYIATTQGESTLWRLMTALHANGRGTSDVDQDAVLVRVLGYDSEELARRAAARIRSIYG